MTTSSLEFRLADPADVQRSCELLATAGWGEVDADTWHRWYIDAPAGAAMLGLAIDRDDRVVAQVELRPSRAVVSGETVMAARLGSIVVHPLERRLYADPMDHPAVGLWLMLEAAATDVGVALVYSLPHSALLRLFRIPGAPFAARTFRCVTMACEPPTSTSSDEVKIVPPESIPVARLWREMIAWTGATCGVERSPEAFASRYSNELVLGLVNGDRIDGYTVTRPHDGLILDALAASPSAMTRVLSATAAHVGYLSQGGAWRTSHISALECDPIAVVLESCGFQPARFRFGFAVARLGQVVDPAAVELSSWYVAGGD